MKLAFYYHTPVFKNKNDIFCPGYIGVFIDSLARHANEVILIMHTLKEMTVESDYKLNGENISLIDLSIKTPAWHRFLFHKSILQNKLKRLTDIDIFLIRAPSPLAPFFYKYFDLNRIRFYIIGDYISTLENIRIENSRDILLKLFLFFNDTLLNRRIRKADIIVNSSALVSKYKSKCKSVKLIKTTTLSDNDFYYRTDTCTKKNINILYTGRIEKAKGLFELIEAFQKIIIKKPNSLLHFVGWEDDIEKPTEKKLIKLTHDLNIRKSVFFHGKKQIGDELNSMYKMADIYVIPSYHEGFPRTVWEAMANSLPVIATKVGSIPDFLKNRVDSLLIEPKNINQIEDSVIELINNSLLRKKIIYNGRRLALENKLENQTSKLIKFFINNE